MFEMRLESYEETLDEARTAGRRSATSPKRRRRVQPGYETVSADLDEVNRRYLELAAVVIEQVNSLTRILSTTTTIHLQQLPPIKLETYQAGVQIEPTDVSTDTLMHITTEYAESVSETEQDHIQLHIDEETIVAPSSEVDEPDLDQSH
ncbi:PREDICTED: uncharacterized protein LOC106820384, partial [Priapulus caudatus]|uniref:Uncharacterized protein LOC106820384 n=1 Tax=Priapulus caudatus TaxID=37621 RepID=A0ABM1F7H2_PRICU